MADNILDAACQRESPQAAKKMTLDTDNAGLSKGARRSPPCPLVYVALQEDPSSVSRPYSEYSQWLCNYGEVLKGLNRLRLNNILCDVTLGCGAQAIPCHGSVLASISSYFKAMFTSGMMQSTEERLTIKGVEPHMIRLLVNYAYTSEVSISSDNVQDLLAASDLFDFKAVREACDAYMKRHRDNNLGTHLKDGRSVDAEKFVDPNHPHSVCDGLNKLRVKNFLCDVILCGEGQEVPCHRAVLASFSSYFEAMFTSGMVEPTPARVTIRGVEPQVIGLMVEYAYTCEVRITQTIIKKTGVISSNVKALLAASDLFHVTAVRDACYKYMKHDMDINNCVEMYRFAEDHSYEGLKKHSIDYILEDFSVIYQQEEFLSLPVERLTEILSSDHLNVPKEDMVLDAAMLWLDRCPTRKQNFEQIFMVLEHIRLPLIISPSYLHALVKACQRSISGTTAHPRRPTVIVMVGAKPRGGFHAFESFDPLTNQWKTVGQLPTKANNPVVFASGSTLYLAAVDGDDIHSPWALWRYNPHTSCWKARKAHTKLKRSHQSLVLLDGYLFAVGGCDDDKTRDSMERYDPNTDTWQLMDSVGVGEHYYIKSCLVALDGYLYSIGAAPEKRSQVAKFNPKTSVWTEVAPMQIPRTQSAACTLNGKIYVTGGLYTDENIFPTFADNTMECYNPKTNQWTMCAPMEAKRYSHSAAVVDGKIYVLGGELHSFVIDDGIGYPYGIECYCEETDTWDTVGQMPAARFGLKCVSLKLRNDHGQPIDDEDDDPDVLDIQ